MRKKLWLKGKRKFESLLRLFDENRKIVFPVLLTLMILGFSTYLSLRTTDLRRAAESDVKMLQYTYLADIETGQTSMVYQEIAKEWFYFSESARNDANLRCVSGLSCLWGLIFLLISFPLLFFKGRFWFIPFSIAGVFLGIALAIHFLGPSSFITNAISRTDVWPFMKIMEREERFENVIETHAFLQEARILYQELNPEWKNLKP